MREGCGSHSVYVCVNMFVTRLPATYLVYKSQVRYCIVPCGVYKVCIEPILLETPSFVFNHCLPCSRLADLFSMDMMNISGLFSRYKVCSFSDSLYKTTANKIFSELTGKLLDLGCPAVGDMITHDHSEI